MYYKPVQCADNMKTTILSIAPHGVEIEHNVDPV
jgi:hypothetical protein